MFICGFNFCQCFFQLYVTFVLFNRTSSSCADSVIILILHKFSAGESSKQQIPRKGREGTQRIHKRTKLVSNFLKPLTEAENIRDCDEAVTEGASSSKAMDVSKREAKSSGKNLRNWDVETRLTRKNRGQPKPMNVPQGLNDRAQTVADTSSNQHAKRVAPVWLSLVSSVNQ